MAAAPKTVFSPDGVVVSMREQRPRWNPTRRAFLTGVGVGVSGVAGCAGGRGDGGDGGDRERDGGGTATGSTAAGSSSPSGPTTVFHAGSLAPPFSAAEPAFEDRYGVQVNREAKGSVASTGKVTQQGRRADVLGVSDFRLLRDRVLPDFGDWYCVFATNAMAIQFREDSPGADEIATENWWEVLSRDGVTVGHSDPSVDPGGYRAVMALQLGAEPFEGERLYDGSTLDDLLANTVVSTGTEIHLESQVASGKLDYALYYRSLASDSALPSVDLQPEVDLSRTTPAYARHYARATVETDSGTFAGAPIAYGMTVPSVSTRPANGAAWVAYFATAPGRSALDEHGLRPVEPVVVPASGATGVPGRVMEHAEARGAFGPLSLATGS